MWSRLKGFKKQYMMPRYKEIPEQMRHKVIDIYQPFLRLWDSNYHGESYYLQMEYIPNSSEPSQEWPANQNSSKSASTNHPGAQTNI